MRAAGTMRWLAVAGVIVASLGFTADAEDRFSAWVDAEGAITLPEDFRARMVHLGSWFVPDGSASGFHDVYTEPETVEAYRRTGKFAYAAIPRNTDYNGGRSANGEPSTIVISKKSRHAEATFLFMQWLVDVKTQTAMLEAAGGGVPIRNSSWDLEVMQSSSFAPLFVAMQGSLENISAKPKMPQFFEIYDELSGILQEVGLGAMSAEEGARRGQAKMEKICKECLLR